jgi:hypothetical protein
LLCGAGAAWHCCYVVVVLLRDTVAEFFLSYSTTSGEKMRARKRKRGEIRNLFLGSIG